MQTEKQISLLQGFTLTVKKVPLGRYAELLKILKNELPKHIGKFQNAADLGSDQLFELFFTVLTDCWPELLKIITVATELTDEQVQKLEVDEAYEIVRAIYEVNNWARLFDKVKKATAQSTPLPTTGSTTSSTPSQENTAGL